jgi:hypothetical protein
VGSGPREEFERIGKGKRKEQWHDEVDVVRCDDY